MLFFSKLQLVFQFTHTRVEIAHIRDSSLIGQQIRSCLRQGCVYADFVNKRR